MRSRTESAAESARSWRVWAERGARMIAVLSLGLAWWLTGRPAQPDAREVRDALDAADAPALAHALADTRRASLALALNAVPDDASRAVLHAARQSGLPVTWQPADTARPLPALAAAAVALADPQGGTMLRVAAPDGAPLALADSLGWLDSAVVQGGGVQWPLDGAPRAFTVTGRGTAAHTAPAERLRLGRLRLFGVPGWEARFVMQALEEAGWTVDAAYTVAPRVIVSAGAPSALDTARYAAVIALDSSAWPQAAAIARFVRSGGGLVLFPEAAAGGSLAALRAGAPGAPAAAIPGALRTDTPREGLALTPLARLADGAVVLERSARSGQPVSVAARRVGAGRVVQAGWANTWEWRMLGGDEAVDAHRDWWRGLVQRAAFTSPESPREAWAPYPGAAAPLADLVARLGPAAPAAELPADMGALPAPPPPWLFAVAALALLGEWWSRRLRGAR